jgi:hypothetical protein
MTTTATASTIERSTTNLHDIRRFLSCHGHGAQPWSSSGEALDQLVGLLEDRAQDETFWKDLSGLLHTLEDRRISPALFSTQDVVSPEAVDALVTAIQDALATAKDRHSSRTAYARGCKTASSLAGFLLLGMAVACGNDDADDTGKDGDSGSAASSEDCAEAVEHGIEGDAAEVFCELIDMIEAADLDEYEREDLMSCLPDMSEAEWSDMLSDWSSMSDEDVEHEMKVLSWTSCETRDDSDLH